MFETTRFWFATGLDIDLDANGMRIDTQSFVSMMIGGIAFSNNYQAENGPIAKDGKTFVLYESSEDAMTLQYAKKDYYLLKFDHSVRGLAIGAPVEFKGFPIGKVVDIWLERNKDNNHIVIPVKIEVEPERINQLEKSQKDATGALKMMVNQGMRAQLKKGNILTGSLYVALDFFKNPNPASLVVHENIIELPTIPATLDELTGNLTTLLSKLAKIPMEEIGSTTLDTIKSLNKTSKSFKQAGDSFTEIMLSSDLKKAIHSFNQSLANLEELTYELEQNLGPAVSLVSEKTFATLDEIQKITASDSAVMFELKRALIELGKAAQSIQHLADQLERHPESIIQGKGKE